MSKRNYNNYNYNYRESLMSQIKVNKRNENQNNLKYFNILNNNVNDKDNLYYSIDRKTKIPKNKIPLSLNKKNIKKVSNEKSKITTKYINRDTFKKTISTYSNDIRIKEGNIIEDLQNNKYLRPMLCASNINNKLMKCQIEEPIKNIYTLSLKKYVKNNIELPFEKNNSPKKNENDTSSENKINFYNLNNKKTREQFNNNFSPKYDGFYLEENKNNSSFAGNGQNQVNNSYLLKNSSINLKKYSVTQSRALKKKGFFSEERKEKNEKENNKIYYKNPTKINSTANTFNNTLRNKNNNLADKYIDKNNTTKIKTNKKLIDNKLLHIYKIKLTEEFVIVLNKFFSKHLNKNLNFFIMNLKNYNRNSDSKNKIYYKKKNDKYLKKRLTDKIKNTKLLINSEKEKEKEKIKAKLTSDTSTNFNLNNKSFSNEIKSSSLSSNILSNLFVYNNKMNNQSSSFLFTEQKHKNYSQSPENSLNKYSMAKIKTKTITYKNQNSGSPNRGGRGNLGDGFVYRKKNLNNDMNKINNINLNNYYSNSIYSKNNNNKKGKIIDIDINLGKPVNIINDHSPLEELFLENNNPFLFKLNTISSKFLKKNKKKIKTKSGSKNKIKPPLRTKRFAEEDMDIINNFVSDSDKPHSPIKQYKENNIIDLNIETNFNKNHQENINNIYDQNKEYIIKDDNLTTRFNSFQLNYKKNNNNNNFKKLDIMKNTPLSIVKYKTEFQKEIKKDIKKDLIFSNQINKRQKANKLYINCIKFFINILNRYFKRKIFAIIYHFKKKKKKFK